MSRSEPAFRARLSWMQMFEDTHDAGQTCLFCGISRPTLRLWWRRYVAKSEAGLCSYSCVRKQPPPKKLTDAHKTLILDLRAKRKLDPKSLQSELERKHDLKLSTVSIWQVLHEAEVPCLRKPYVPQYPKRYSLAVPREQVQMDTMHVGTRLYQFTAVDDCTRMRVLGVYTARTAENAVDLLVERVVEELPFPVQRIQTDRSGEFFGLAFQQAMRDGEIKFRPLSPASPHLNGKVERSQQSGNIEFRAPANKSDPALADHLAKWQFYYNWKRPQLP